VNILVDHSGYDLLNIGDVAMVQTCVRRLQEVFPGARVEVVCHDPAALTRYIADALPVVIQAPPVLRRLRHERVGRAVEQVGKVVAPMIARHRWPAAHHPIVAAVARADLVVASGGGYVNDTYWWHAAGVLSALDLAQRRGIPTAMFGQGVGPLTHRLVRHQANQVFPSLRMLGLREGFVGKTLSAELGAPSHAIRVTGDDALELAQPANIGSGAHTTGTALGINLRVAAYTGTDAGKAQQVAAALRTAVAADLPELVVLPVSRYAAQSDLDSTTTALRDAGLDFEADDLADPSDLVRQIGRCNAVVTSSYHVAVFAMAQGVPAVCLTASRYYDAKFEGLRELFPEGSTVVPLDGPAVQERLTAAVQQATSTSAADRRAILDAARANIARSRSAYTDLAASLGALPTAAA
jgi:colanic acid/amylovoran biosynthesis protein